uniref:Vacuolar protein sorting-associated protein 52 homolog n=1 Tax=Gongylonema pulchrum TaxID=637853 RepID=A0A183DYY3_9BILA
LESGVDLRQYSSELHEQLRTAHSLAVKDCIEQAEKLAQLHTEITACDDAFANAFFVNIWFFFQRLEDMLQGFQSELGTICSDMKRLQQQSIDISQQLQNRQQVRGELSQFVDDMVVPNSMIQAIVERDVGDREFLEQLHELQHKLQFLKAQEFRDAKAACDVHDVVENLKLKVSAEALFVYRNLFSQAFACDGSNKIVHNFGSFVESFGKNRQRRVVEVIFCIARILKRAAHENTRHFPSLLDEIFRFFYEFLLANDRQVARELTVCCKNSTAKLSFVWVGHHRFFFFFFRRFQKLLLFQVRDEYMEVVSKMFFTYFKTYASRLFRLLVSCFIPFNIIIERTLRPVTI